MVNLIKPFTVPHQKQDLKILILKESHFLPGFACFGMTQPRNGFFSHQLKQLEFKTSLFFTNVRDSQTITALMFPVVIKAAS